MSIRLYNSSGGYIDLESGGTSAAANVFTLPAETGTILTSATLSGINASALSAGTLPGARLPAGSVLQVVSNTSSQGSTTSTSYVDTGLTVSITPTSASNKILVLISMPDLYNNDAVNATSLNVVRASTQIIEFVRHGNYRGASSGGLVTYGGSTAYLDSPNTTSSTTYKVQIKTSADTTYWAYNNSTATITLMEIAA